MAESNARTRRPFEGKIPEEARRHAHAAREEFCRSIESLFPPEFVEHRRQASKEVLLAWRSLIDATLEKMEKTEKRA